MKQLPSNALSSDFPRLCIQVYSLHFSTFPSLFILNFLAFPFPFHRHAPATPFSYSMLSPPFLTPGSDFSSRSQQFVHWQPSHLYWYCQRVANPWCWLVSCHRNILRFTFLPEPRFVPRNKPYDIRRAMARSLHFAFWRDGENVAFFNMLEERIPRGENDIFGRSMQRGRNDSGSTRLWWRKYQALWRGQISYGFIPLFLSLSVSSPLSVCVPFSLTFCLSL